MTNQRFTILWVSHLWLVTLQITVINRRQRKATYGQYKKVTNDWHYDASCTLKSLVVSDLENFKHFIFVARSVKQEASLLCLATPALIS
jgi:hypothetical protein